MKLKTLLNTTITSLLLIMGTISGHAQTVIASWSFDALVAPTASVPTASVINADFGALSASSNAYLDGSNGSSAWVSTVTSPELTTFSGSTLNDPRTTPTAGNALALANNSANGKMVVFKFPTTGYSNISLSFATRGTSTGFNNHAWEWSTDNVTYTAFGSNTAVNISTFTLETLDLSSITAVNDQPTVYIRLTVSGATSSTGNNRIDNFVVTGTAVSTGPPVATFDPANSATDVNIVVTPTITFDKAIRNIDNSDITDANVASLLVLKETDDAGADVPFTATIDADKKVITVNPTASLAFNQLYYLALNPVEDDSDNATTLEAVTFTTRAASTDATVSSLTYTIDNTAETIIDIPFSATLTNFKANLTPAAGATFEVYQTDGSTVATDLATGYKVMVTAEDGTTTKTYTITVNATASTEANITNFTVASVTGTIDGSAHTVAVTVPFGTNVTALVPTITLSAGATVDPASGVAQDFTSPVTYTVTAEDGTTTQPWVVTVTVAPAPAPTFTATYPKSANIGSDQFDVVVNLDAAGKVYFQQVASGAAAPTSADLKANGTSIDVTAAATDYSATITGLDANTAYDVYFATENATGDVLMATPVKLTVTTTAGTITIHDIQYTANASGDSPYKDQEVTTSGIVTAIKLSSTTGAQQAFYIQDGTGAWNGIYVYSATPAVALGDNVTVTGTVAEYNNLTEISPVSSAVVVSQNNPLPDPAEITTQDANTEAYEGVLVKIMNVSCVSGSAGTFVVNDGSGDLTAYKSLFPDFALTVGSHYDITGVMTWFSTASLYELYPRNINDVTLLTGIGQNSSVATRAFPNPFSDNFTVNSGKVVSTVSIYNLLGQKLMERSYSAAEVTVPAANLTNGIYIVNVRFQDGSAATLRMVKK